MRAEHGRVVSKGMRQGNEFHHAAAEDKEEITREDMWDRIYSGERHVFLEEPFMVKIDDFLFRGTPDAVVFDNGRPQLIFDRKTTWNTDTLYKNQRVQVWLYGLMFEQLGLDTQDLQVAILRHHYDVHPETAVALQERTLDRFDEWDDGVTELLPNAKVHLFPYDRDDHLDDILWAFEYWRDDREPIPTTNEAKCGNCEYSEQCPSALV